MSGRIILNDKVRGRNIKHIGDHENIGLERYMTIYQMTSFWLKTALTFTDEGLNSIAMVLHLNFTVCLWIPLLVVINPHLNWLVQNLIILISLEILFIF